MAATRDGLEAVIREQLTRCIANALTSGVPSTGIMNRATETILGAADEYATAEVGLLTPAERRRVIEDAP
jgi:hypothetical protein